MATWRGFRDFAWQSKTLVSRSQFPKFPSLVGFYKGRNWGRLRKENLLATKEKKRIVMIDEILQGKKKANNKRLFPEAFPATGAIAINAPPDDGG